MHKKCIRSPLSKGERSEPAQKPTPQRAAGKPELRLRTIAELHLAALAACQTSLIVAPTHVEAREIASVVRAIMRDRGLLGEDRVVSRLAHLGWTDAQRFDPAGYESGQVIQFHNNATGGYKSGEQWTVVRHAGNTVIVERNGQERCLPVHKAHCFEVYRPEQLTVAIGDTVRVTKNFKVAGGEKYVNNALHKVTGITADSIELDGKSIPLGLLHLDQGIAVTSYASQGKTVDQVIVSAPIESFCQVSREMFYVAMSRARSTMHLLTDSKEALRAAIVRSSARLSPALEQTRQIHQQTYDRDIGGREMAVGCDF